jgi:hypothetical protein
MAYDAENMFRNTGTDLTTTLTGTGFLIDGTPLAGLYVRVSVPQATGTTPTLDITIQESDTLGSGYTTVTTFDQITAAGVFWRRFASKKKYARGVFTVAGTTPILGKVQAGFSSGPEYLG